MSSSNISDTIIVYKSRYGATKRYAQWLASALKCDVLDQESVKDGRLNRYNTIIYGGGLYAGGVNGLSFITKNFDAMGGKNIVLFTCGLADPTDESNIQGIKASLDKRLTPQMQKRIKVFHLRGGMDYARLSPVHRAMMAMLKGMLAKKDGQTLRQEDREMLATHGKAVDFTDEAAIAPLAEYVKGL